MPRRGPRRPGAEAYIPAVSRIRVGTSGYQYRHWRGVLYPEGLPQRRWLPRYAGVGGHAVHDALALLELVGEERTAPGIGGPLRPASREDRASRDAGDTRSGELPDPGGS